MLCLNGIVYDLCIHTHTANTEDWDLLKATIFSAGQAVAYTLLLVLLAAPDLVLAYVAVGVGMYTALFLFIISRTERYEKAYRGDEE